MSERLSMECFVKCAPFIKAVLGEEVTIGLFDTEKQLYYVPGINLDHKSQNGEPIRPGSLTDKTLRSGDRVSAEVGSEIYGVPYLGHSVCITDESGVKIGAITICVPITNAKKIREITENLNSLLGDISVNTTSLSASSEELASTTHNVAGNSQQMLDHVARTNDILQLINDVSSQTHLLGLNAAIEAARAGDQGRGFNVVAEEIRKLAGKTSSSVKDINSIIEIIRNSIVQLNDEIGQISAVSQEQAASTQKILNSIQDLVDISSQLQGLSKELVK